MLIKNGVATLASLSENGLVPDLVVAGCRGLRGLLSPPEILYIELEVGEETG